MTSADDASDVLAAESSATPEVRLEALLRGEVWMVIVRADGESPRVELVDDADVGPTWLSERLSALPENVRLEVRTWSGRAWREDAVPPRD